MSQYITFVTQNWELFLALVVIVGLLAGHSFSSSLRGYRTVTPQEATRLMNHENAVVIDVREANEYHSGHIINAQHIPQGHVRDRLGELERHKDKPIIVGCRSGQRSGRVCGQLKKAGFEKVYNLGGGVLAWQNAGLPLSKKK